MRPNRWFTALLTLSLLGMPLAAGAETAKEKPATGGGSTTPKEKPGDATGTPDTPKEKPGTGGGSSSGGSSKSSAKSRIKSKIAAAFRRAMLDAGVDADRADRVMAEIAKIEPEREAASKEILKQKLALAKLLRAKSNNESAYEDALSKLGEARAKLYAARKKQWEAVQAELKASEQAKLLARLKLQRIAHWHSGD